ncbi:hypothetical protein EBZ39_14270 [bacterium]|nr:hypothetical protein [bacterium]
MEIAKSVDIVSSDLICRSQYGDGLIALGKYFVNCYDKDGVLKWTDEAPNLVVNAGLQYMAGTSLDGATTRITSWFVGLITGPGSGTTFAAGDTLASHAGWTESSAYSGSRPAATFAAATTANPSVVTWLQTLPAKHHLVSMPLQLLPVHFYVARLQEHLGRYFLPRTSQAAIVP